MPRPALALAALAVTNALRAPPSLAAVISQAREPASASWPYVAAAPTRGPELPGVELVGEGRVLDWLAGWPLGRRARDWDLVVAEQVVGAEREGDGLALAARVEAALVEATEPPPVAHDLLALLLGQAARVEAAPVLGVGPAGARGGEGVGLGDLGLDLGLAALEGGEVVLVALAEGLLDLLVEAL